MLDLARSSRAFSSVEKFYLHTADLIRFTYIANWSTISTKWVEYLINLIYVMVCPLPNESLCNPR